MSAVTCADVVAANEVLEGVVRRTPLVRSRALTERFGRPVYLKCENLQRAGSFKIRGAYTRMSRLTPQERARGVVAASAGNHAQGVALAAKLLGIEARIYMPVGAPLPKLDATLGYGAKVELTGHSVDDCIVAATEHANQTGALLIHPFDHPDVVAGQGTVALEILEQLPDAGTVLVGTGGGGLLAGIATVLRHRRPGARLIGVQAQGAAAYPPSLSAGSPRPLPSMSTMADGVAVGRPGDVPFEIIRDLVDGFVTVTEEEISGAMLLLMERQKLVVEPAGAVSVAPLLRQRSAGVDDLLDGAEGPLVAVLSGGNVDPLLLLRLIRHGMAAAGRYLLLRVRTPDRPGSLAALLATLAATDANVLEVEHVRTGPALPVNDVEIAVWLETRGPHHCTSVLAGLVEAGYHPQVQ